MAALGGGLGGNLGPSRAAAQSDRPVPHGGDTGERVRGVVSKADLAEALAEGMEIFED
jgi:hypothetical protein